MLDAGNRIDSMDKMMHIIDDTKKKSKDKFEEFLEHIENEYANGHFEPENYEMLKKMLDSGVMPDQQKAFDEDTLKMLSLLQALRQKIDEYIKISG